MKLSKFKRNEEYIDWLESVYKKTKDLDALRDLEGWVRYFNLRSKINRGHLQMKKLYHVEFKKRMYVLAEDEKAAIRVGRQECAKIDLAEDEFVRAAYYDEGIDDAWRDYPPFGAEGSEPNKLTVKELVERMRFDREARLRRMKP